MSIAVVVAALAVLAIVAFIFLRKRGYRGAIGFKNRHGTEIAAVRLTGFSAPVECRTLGPGEHSFNYMGRQNIPIEVRIAWRFVGEADERTATVSLSAVPRDAADGELFFVLSSDGSWSAEYAPRLDLDALQRSQ